MDTASHTPGQYSAFRLIESKIFAGANRYHSTSVIRQHVDFGDLSGTASVAAGEQFAPAYLARFDGLTTFVPGNGLSEAFRERLNSPQGVSLEELLLQAILAVEAAVAFAMHELENVSFAVIEHRHSVTGLIWECNVPRLSRAAAIVASAGVSELLPSHWHRQAGGLLPEYHPSLANLLQRARRRRLSPATAVIKLAAKQRGMPCEALARQHLRIGEGARQQLIYASMTSTTSITAQKVCSDKQLTNRRLRELRLPTARQIRVDSIDAARVAAERLGFPIVIKPMKSKKGQGVTAGLTDAHDVPAAFELARKSGSDVLVERFIEGADHRLLVVGGRFVAALTRQPPTITGNGHDSVDALVDALNADPRRDGFRLFKVEKDAEMMRLLAMEGLSLTDVLSDGRTVALRSAANVSTGGLPFDVTDRVHPDNREMAERAARGVGLDVAGVDFLTPDISSSYREVGGGIVEINARPGLDIHIWPYTGTSRNVAAEILKLSFPPECDGRIPSIAVVGDQGTGATARLLDGIVRATGRRVALALRKGAYVDGVSAELSSSQQKHAARILLRDPDVDTLVSTVSARRSATHGMGVDSYQVSVIMDKAKEGSTAQFHLGLDVVQRATTACFVVGVWNTVALSRLRDLGSRRLILVSERIDNPDLQRHLRAGHAAVVTRWEHGELRYVLLSGNDPLASIPAGTSERKKWRAAGRRENASLFAIAAAYGLGLLPAELTAAFRNIPAMVTEAA